MSSNEKLSTNHPTLQSHVHQTLLHNILILFSLIYLPRSSYPYSLDGSDAPVQTKSADKPQSWWLNPITFNLVYTLGWWLLGSVVICVFRAGWIRRHIAREMERVQVKVAGKGAVNGDTGEGKVLLTRLVQALVAPVLLTPLTATLLVLLGAPVNSDPSKMFSMPNALTPILAMLLNFLVFFIPCYALGLPISNVNEMIDSIPGLSSLGISSRMQVVLNIDKSTDDQVLAEWVRLFVQFSPTSTADKVLVYPALGSLAGGWVGVIPIALDWERPWQAYPLTPAAGALLGFVTGSLLALLDHVWIWATSLAVEQPSYPLATRPSTSQDCATHVKDNQTSPQKTMSETTAESGSSTAQFIRDGSGKRSSRKRKGKPRGKVPQDVAATS